MPAGLMDAPDVKTVLEAFGVPGWRGVYVLGSIDRRITVYSQQVRALNLAAALLASERVQSGDDIVVVGAGAAGLTCAAALHSVGANVTLLEARNEILSLFRGGSKRWLHPGVYDWPLDGWDRDDAGLPLLSWHHGTVRDVRTQLEAAWANIEKGVLVHTAASNVRIGPMTQSSRAVTWDPSERVEATTVVLAVGFGLESAELPTEKRYWEGDSLDAPTIDGQVRRWLVSGSGDGALTDLLRLTIRDFQHDRMLCDFAAPEDSDDVAKQIRRIEADPGIQDDAKRLHFEYARLRTPCLEAAIKSRLRSDTKVTLASSGPDFLSNRASPLNRLLVGQLVRLGCFTHIPSRLVSAEQRGNKVDVVFADESAETFDGIVRRHGPRSALAESFPGVAKALQADIQQRRAKPNLTDGTRARLWAPGAFGAEAAAGKMRVRAVSGPRSRSEASVAAAPVPDVPTSSFVGRTAELAQLASALTSAKEGLPPTPVTLFGMAGVGKSYLACHFANIHSEAFPGGYLRISLRIDENRSGADLVLHLAAQLQTKAQNVRRSLEQSKTLLVIDNADCEKAGRAAADLCDCLQGLPTIVTGRQYELGVSAGWTTISVPPLTRKQAVGFLRGYVPPAVGEGVVAGLDRLASALGDLPLALYLAAGLLRRGVSPTSLLTQLVEHGLELKSLDPTDPRARVDASRAALESSLALSWACLVRSAGEACALSLASLGTIPTCEFGSDLGARVAGMDQAEFDVSSTHLVSLCMLSPPIMGRWSLHPLIAKLLYDKRRFEADRRMHEIFDSEMSRAVSGISGIGLSVVLGDGAVIPLHTKFIREEASNLALWLKELPAREISIVAERHQGFAVMFGPFDLWAQMISTVASPSQALEFTLCRLHVLCGRRSTALRKAESIDRGNLAPRDAIDIALLTAELRGASSGEKKVLQEYSDVLQLALELGDSGRQAQVQLKIAEAQRDRGNHLEALRVLEADVLPEFRISGGLNLTHALRCFAEVQLELGDRELALRTLEEEVLPTLEMRDCSLPRAHVFGQIADARYYAGEFDEAIRIRRDEELPLYRSLGALVEVAKAKGKLADSLVARGAEKDFQEAREYLEEAEQTFLISGETKYWVVARQKTANLLGAMKHFDEALHVLTKEVLPYFRNEGNRRDVALCTSAHADFLCARAQPGDSDQALQLLADSRATYKELGDIRLSGRATAKIAEIHAIRGDFEVALPFFADALSVLSSLSGEKEHCDLIRSFVVELEARTSSERPFEPGPPGAGLKRRDPCHCGSGRTFGRCCGP